ncbi:MAG: ABC transporter substrate-binding protein [Thermodesulfobacteriota bacterium]
MQKKIFLLMLAVLLAGGVAWPGFGQAALPGKRPKVIAVLLYSKNNIPSLEGLKAGLRELGYVEGQEVEYAFEGTVESIQDLDQAMTRLLNRQPDLVYAAPTPAAQVAQKHCREKQIPVLFGPVNNAVKVGLVADRARPGGNITGVMLEDSEGKRLQWGVEIAPRVKNVLVPYNPEDKSSLLSLESAGQAAASLGITVIGREVRDHAAIDALIAQWPEGVDSVFLPRDSLIMSRIKDFAAVSIRHKIVLSATRIELVEQGALYSYGFDGMELGRQVARLADQIFKGRKPGDLPVETAEDYLAINLKTAKAIGLQVDEQLLRLAHRVVRP